MKILIVEDQILTALAVKSFLTKSGHEVVSIADSFKEAVNAILTYLPDIIVMDIELGDSSQSGIDVLDEINVDVPVIFLTGKTDRETFLKASLKNPAAFLTKPFREEDLLYQIELAAIKKAKLLQETPPPTSFYIYNRESYIKIQKKEVIYLEANKVYTLIYLRNRNAPVVATMNLGHLEQHFTESNFKKVSKSIIINEDYLTEIRNNELFFEGIEKPIEISDSKKADFKKKLLILKSPRPKN